MTIREDLDNSILLKVSTCDPVTLVLWAIDCSERVLSRFEDAFPNDIRARAALEAARSWTNEEMGEMEARKAGFDALTAAEEAEAVPSAAAAARACGQAAITPHNPTHAIYAANYATRAVETGGGDGFSERMWQFEDLIIIQNAADEMMDEDDYDDYEDDYELD